MPVIKVSDKDLKAIAGAALEAASIGDMDEARTLDKLAEKIEKALSCEHQAAGVPEHLPVVVLSAREEAPAEDRLPMQPDRASSV